MTTFQQTVLILIVIWLGMVIVRFRRSIIVLIAGLFAIGLYTLVAFVYSKVTLVELGLRIPNSWVSTAGFSLAWLGLMLAYSPLVAHQTDR